MAAACSEPESVDWSHLLWQKFQVKYDLELAWMRYDSDKSRIFRNLPGLNFANFKRSRISKHDKNVTRSFTCNDKTLIWVDELSLTLLGPIANRDKVGSAAVVEFLEKHFIIGHKDIRDEKIRKWKVAQMKQDKLECQLAMKLLEKQLNELEMQKEQAQPVIRTISAEDAGASPIVTPRSNDTGQEIDSTPSVNATATAMEDALNFTKAAIAYATSVSHVSRSRDSSPEFTVAYQAVQQVNGILNNVRTCMLNRPNAGIGSGSQGQAANTTIAHHQPFEVANARRDGAQLAFSYFGAIIQSLVQEGVLSARRGHFTLTELAGKCGLSRRVTMACLAAQGSEHDIEPDSNQDTDSDTHATKKHCS